MKDLTMVKNNVTETDKVKTTVTVEGDYYFIVIHYFLFTINTITVNCTVQANNN